MKDINPQIQEAKEPKTKEVRGNLHPDRHGNPSEHSGPRPRATTEVGPQAGLALTPLSPDTEPTGRKS